MTFLNQLNILFSLEFHLWPQKKVFEWSNCYLHAAELLNILRPHYTNDDVINSDKIWLLFSNGSGDLNVTHISTQILLICLLLQFDLEMLIALWCCLSQSWVNPAEQVMSLLNLALQNCVSRSCWNCWIW